MEAVLKQDPTVADWPLWNVSRSSAVAIDGFEVQELFAMIHRQIEVLRHTVRNQDLLLTSFQRREDDVRERFERESAKLHDRVDRMIKSMEDQKQDSALEEKLKIVERKVTGLEEQLKAQNEAVGMLKKNMERFIEEQYEEHSDHSMAAFESKASPILAASVVTTQRSSEPKNRKLSISSETSHNQPLSPNKRGSISTDHSFRKLPDTSAQRSPKPMVEKPSGGGGGGSGQSKRMFLSEEMLMRFQAIEDTLLKLENHSVDIEDRLIHSEGGIIAFNTRLNNVEDGTAKTAVTINNFQKILREAQLQLSDEVVPDIQRLFTEKANVSDMRTKADLSVILKKADATQINRIDEIINDIERRVLVMNRDFEEGLEAVQKKHDKKLEFMTQWIVKHVRKGQISNAPTATGGDGADIGKTKCLVCDQPVKYMEKDTPFSPPGFKNTLGTLKTEKRPLPDENANRGGARVPGKQEDGKGARPTTPGVTGRTKRATSPAADREVDVDGPIRHQKVYYTGGSEKGAAIAMNNKIHNTVPLVHSHTVTTILHYPSTSALNTSGPETDKLDMNSPSHQLGEFYRDMDKKYSARPSSAPLRRESKVKKAVAAASASNGLLL